MHQDFDKTGIRKRCRSRRANMGLSQVEMALLAGCTQQSIAQIELGGSYSLSLLEKIAAAMDVRLEWLRTGEEPMRAGRNVRPAPVVSCAAAGKAGGCKELARFRDETLRTDCPDPDCFALIMEGNAMEPVIRAGDRVVVMPGAAPQSGDIVVARRRGTQEALVRLAHFDGSGQRVTLTSYNPAHPPKECSRKEFDFIHPVHSLQRLFRGR